MGRKSALFGFWLTGYIIGVLAWLARVPTLRFIENLGLSAELGEALLAGLLGSTIMVVGVLLWSFLASG